MGHPAAELSVRVARLIAPVRVLGPGRRLALWVQGCGIGCAGCASQDTWDPAGGDELPVAELAARITRWISSEQLDGLTVTGGEPTDQALPLTALLTEVRPACPDILVFTGRSYAAARARAGRLLALADAVVAGPYRADLAYTNRLLATANQELVVHSATAGERYADWLADGAVPVLEVLADDTDLYLVGLPRAGDLDRFAARLADRGVLLEGRTWS